MLVLYDLDRFQRCAGDDERPLCSLSDLPVRILWRKYFSNLILAAYIHLPDDDQLTLRGRVSAGLAAHKGDPPIRRNRRGRRHSTSPRRRRLSAKQTVDTMRDTVDHRLHHEADFGTPTGTDVAPVGELQCKRRRKDFGKGRVCVMLVHKDKKPRGLVSPSMPATASSSPRKAGSIIVKLYRRVMAFLQ